MEQFSQWAKSIAEWVEGRMDGFAILGIDPLIVHFALAFLLVAGGVWLFEPLMEWLISANWKRLLVFLVICLSAINLFLSIQLYQVMNYDQTVAENVLGIEILAVVTFGVCYTLYGLGRQIYRLSTRRRRQS
ncbi:hypothetical protein [Thalassobacillus pellis]|uniref:hypothetical protein n=1 Tax=Thalassobacillus pellis TaxID=748008 RepID=UPI001961532A|nr:hypothetical protein [Thalassobacillus pellis]MBM7552964.1 putative membrane protein [Thalassobacillus pellis]